MKNRKLNTASDLRGALLATIEAVLEGRVNISQANAIVGLSTELHKSIKLEWDIRCYASENLNLNKGEVINFLGSCENE